MKTIGELEVFIFERFKSENKARKLQAIEYARRLEALNGEAGRLREMQQEYVPREVFQKTVDSINEKIQTLNDWKTAQGGKSDNRIDLQKIVLFVIAIVTLGLYLYATFK